jgi:hypothetical protein
MLQNIWSETYLGIIKGGIVVCAVIIFWFFYKKWLKIKERYQVEFKELIIALNTKRNKVLLFLLLPLLYTIKTSIIIYFLNNGHWLDLGDQKFWLKPYTTEEILINPSIHGELWWILLIIYCLFFYFSNKGILEIKLK